MALNRFLLFCLRMLLLSSLLFTIAYADWAWVGGTQTANIAPSFQQLLVETANNQPGGLADMAYTTNGSYIIVFGGDLSGAMSNNLVRYNTETQRWSAFFTSPSMAGEYNVQGVFSAIVQPDAKYGSTLFYDKESNSVFVFGGSFDSDTTDNMLFEFSADLGMWRWLHGSSILRHAGSYGELKVESPTNIPPSRAFTAAFYDQVTKTAYIFGGFFCSKQGIRRPLGLLCAE